MRLQIIHNDTYFNEAALINVDTKEMIFKDSIGFSGTVYGFMKGLRYLGEYVEMLESIDINPKDHKELFEKYGFFNAWEATFF